MCELNFAEMFYSNTLLFKVLPELLKDRTTDKNIIWATSTYQDYGAYYHKDRQMFPDFNINFIMDEILLPRIQKSKLQQVSRTKEKAEVFTPSWICNKMNNYLDLDYFGKKDVFNTEKEKSWIINTKKISFKRNEWKQYVLSKRIEITCGEAPYLVSVYDTTSGELIDIKNRIGILDRKLRVIGENIHSERNWLKWTVKAFESVYGFEYQGDNLFFARINLVQTFIDYYEHKFHKLPSLYMTKKIAKIVSWNLWQMDGLTKTVPFIPKEGFPSENKIQDNIYCKIKDWETNTIFKYKDMKGEIKMKFDYCIGNPPYQIKSNGNKPSDESVYNYFIDASFEIANKVELITPARFLFNNGNTPKKWNEKMLNDEHFKVLEYEQNSSNIFLDTDIRGGVLISYRDVNKEFGAIKTFTNFEQLNSILKKVTTDNFISIMNIIFNQNKFNLNFLYQDFNFLKTRISSNGNEKRMTSGCLEYECFHNESESIDDIKILGLQNNKRVYKWINKKYVDNDNIIDKYKVIVPANNGSGALGENISTPLIGTPLIGITQTFISIGKFDTQQDAENALKYIKTKFARTMLGILKVTQNGKRNTWKYVPLQDFTENSDIDWNKSIPEIDKQLYQKYSLSDEEISFIETHVKEME